MNRVVYVCLVRFSNASDNVKHGNIIELLKSTGVDSNGIKIVANLQWNQSARIRFNKKFSENSLINETSSLRLCIIIYAF